MCEIGDKEVDEMKERLARMEVSIVAISKQMDHMVNLLIRVVKVEEHLEEDRRTLGRLYERLEYLESTMGKATVELEKWATARKIFLWVTGTGAALAAVVVAWGKNSQ